jgi:hypothetical protein
VPEEACRRQSDICIPLSVDRTSARGLLTGLLRCGVLRADETAQPKAVALVVVR